MIIDKYDMAIYPRKLWVATAWDKSIAQRFTYDDKDRTELEDVDDNYGAATYGVRERKSGYFGVLVVFRSVNEYGKGSEVVKDVAHESVHVMSKVFKAVGIVGDYNNDEPIAYIVGWAAKCCWKTLSKVLYDKKIKETK